MVYWSCSPPSPLSQAAWLLWILLTRMQCLRTAAYEMFFFLIPLCIMHSHMCTGCMHNMHIFANVSGTARTCLLEGRMVLNPLIIFFHNMLLNEQWTYSDQIFFSQASLKRFLQRKHLKTIVAAHLFCCIFLPLNDIDTVIVQCVWCGVLQPLSTGRASTPES